MRRYEHPDHYLGAFRSLAEKIGSAEVLGETGGHIVAARYKNQLVTAFHPELCDDMYVYEYFLSMIN